MKCFAFALTVAVALGAPSAWACDSCAVYTYVTTTEGRPGWYAGLFTQYADFGDLVTADGEAGTQGEALESTHAQAFLGYQFEAPFSVQVTVPYIDRSFTRLAVEEADHHHGALGVLKHGEEPSLESGSERGIGDVVVSAIWRAVENHDQGGSLVWSVSAGVTIPTGDSDRLAEHVAAGHDDHEHGLGSTAEKHGTATSAIGGHDLALGTGTTGFVLGSRLFVSRGRVYTAAGAQYAVRREGDFDYRMGNELTWDLAVGWVAAPGHGTSVAVGLRVSGNDRDADELAGATHHGGSSAVWAGPAVNYSIGMRWSMELDLEKRLAESTTFSQLLPDYRARIAVIRRF